MRLASVDIPPPPNPVNDSRNTNKLRNYGIVAFVIVVVLIGSVILFGWLAPQAQTAQKVNDSFFKGAYATYYGEATVYGQKLGVQLRVEIVDMNSTHFKTLTYIKMDSNTAGTILEEQETEWTSVSDASMDYSVDGMMFLSKRDDSVYFPTIGTRDCTIFEYQYKAGSGVDGSMTAYLEPLTGWPYKIVYNLTVSGIEVNFDIPIESTNVPILR